jgi:hypothetical protein
MIINIFCFDYIYNNYNDIIENLIERYDFFKKIIIENEDDMYQYIIKNELLYSNNILIGLLEENLLNRLSTINYCNNFYLLNLRKILENEDLSYLKNNKINILDFDDNNINLSKKYFKFIKIYNLLNNNINIYNYEKTKDVAIFGSNSDLKINLYKKLKYNNVNIDIIEKNDENLFKYKLFINMDDQFEDNIFYDNLIYNKVIILHKKSEYNNNKSEIYNKYSIDLNIDIAPVFTLFILKNYEQNYNNLYNNFNTNNLKDNFINKNNNVFNEIIKKEKYGFIIVRHVNSEATNNYWIESYNSIRKYYDNKIIIIDDNSNYEYIKYDNLNIINCTIIQSEHNSRGEILGYYYFYKYRFFEKAVIIHDSVFINKYIDFDIYGDIKFIWHFTQGWFDETAEKNLIESINYSNDLKKYYNQRDKINGCFGVQSVITYSFLNHIEIKYDLFNLLKIIDSRIERMNFERIFALICINEKSELYKNPSIFGIIHEYTRFGYSYDDYLKDKSENKLDKCEIIKIWTGR